MHPRPTATALVAAACLMAVSACSTDDPATARDPARSAPSVTAPSVTAPSVTAPSVTAPSASASSASSEQAAGDPLAGAWATDPIAVSRLVEVAQDAGFGRADVDEFRAGLQGVRQVVYTLKLVDGFWVAFESRDGGTASDVWAGPYRVLGRSTVRAGEKPCGPILYDYRLSGDRLSLTMTEDRCYEADGTVAAGELIAQTALYESASFHRIG